MKRLITGLFAVAMIFASTTTEAQKLPTTRSYISGVQGSVNMQDLNTANVIPTFASTKDTFRLFPGAYITFVYPSDSLGVGSDTVAVFTIRSSYGSPSGSYPGDVMKFQVQAANITIGNGKQHVNFRNLYGKYFVWTTGADSTTTLTSKQTLYLEFQCKDGNTWIEKSRIVHFIPDAYEWRYNECSPSYSKNMRNADVW